MGATMPERPALMSAGLVSGVERADIGPLPASAARRAQCPIDESLGSSRKNFRRGADDAKIGLPERFCLKMLHAFRNIARGFGEHISCMRLSARRSFWIC